MHSQLKQWLRQVFRRSTLQRQRRPSRPLGVEALESRTLPAAVLSVTPISWNVVGLDSNNVNAGPNHYLVGARVTNTGDTTATNVRASYTWDSSNALINLLSPPNQSVAA